MEASRLGEILSKEAGEVWVKVFGDRVVIFVNENPIATLPSNNLPDGVLVVGNLTLNFNTRQVSCGDRYVSLTRSEFDVLYHLVLSKERVTSYDTLAEVNYISRRSLVQHLSDLRRKLQAADWSGRITTIRGVGLRITT